MVGRTRYPKRPRSVTANAPAEMVKGGHAWAFVKYSTRYVSRRGRRVKRATRALAQSQQAAAAAVGVPSEALALAEQTAPDGCPIKGNISGKKRIYHPPPSPWQDERRPRER